jgi:hypothetical protein
MNTSRRAILSGLAGTATALGSLGTAGATSTATQSDCSQTGFPVSRGNQKVSMGAKGYAEADKQGALLENIHYDSPKFCNIADVHYVVFDGDVARNTRDDGCGIANVTVSMIPELTLNNTIPLTDGTATLDQRSLVTADKSAILVENELQFPTSGEHTIFTLANPDIGDLRKDPGAEDTAHLTSRGYYDVIVASDGDYHAAFAQRESWRKQFDGHRIGIEGVTSGSDKSAWQDAYVEADGTLDTNTERTGDVDLAFGLTVNSRETLNWDTAIGFGTDESTAIDNAVNSLDTGYETERSKHIPWL